MLAALGLQPVTFRSADVLKQQISTESKVFSIYSTGHVQAGSRFTQTKIHAVVDFRAAPPPGVDQRALATQNLVQNAMNPQGGLGTGGTTGTPTAPGLGAAASTGFGSGLPGGAVGPIQALMKPSPGGSILYFRVD
jgi:hypothetical protein